MDVAVIAERNTVLFQKRKDLFTAVIAVNRRVVQENEFGPVPCRLERCLEPHDLAAHDLGVMLAALLLLVKPAARAAQGIVAGDKAVVWRMSMVVIPCSWKKRLVLAAVVHQ